MIGLADAVPLGCFTCHVECGEEHFTGRRRLLDAEELIALIQPLKRIIGAVKGGEEKLVAVLGGLHRVVVVVPWQRRATIGGVDLVGLQAIDGHREAVVVTLNRRQLVLD
jgi:hypothetical protein